MKKHPGVVNLAASCIMSIQRPDRRRTEGASGLHITQHRLLSQLLHLIYKPRIL